MADAEERGKKATLSITEDICDGDTQVRFVHVLSQVVSIADCTSTCGNRVHCEGVEFGNVPKVSKALCVTSVP